MSMNVDDITGAPAQDSDDTCKGYPNYPDGCPKPADDIGNGSCLGYGHVCTCTGTERTASTLNFYCETCWALQQ